MATYAKPGDFIRVINNGLVIHIITNTLHENMISGHRIKVVPKVPWDRYNLDGIYEFTEETIVTRILDKYHESTSK